MAGNNYPCTIKRSSKKNAPKLLTLFLVGSTFLWSQEQSTFGDFQLGRERHSDPKGWPAIARLKNFWKKRKSVARAELRNM